MNSKDFQRQKISNGGDVGQEVMANLNFLDRGSARARCAPELLIGQWGLETCDEVPVRFSRFLR